MIWPKGPRRFEHFNSDPQQLPLVGMPGSASGERVGPGAFRGISVPALTQGDQVLGNTPAAQNPGPELEPTSAFT